MWKDIVHVLHGYMIWQALRLKYRIGYPKVVLVLAGQNKELDAAALAYLGYYAERKYAKGAVIVLVSDDDCNVPKPEFPFHIQLCICKRKKAEALYDAYGFYKFYDNIAFTYDNRPEDNLLGKLLKEGLIDEKEAVCLGLFGLKKAPEAEEGR